MTDAPIIQADFVKPMPVPSRKVLQLVFEVPEEAADHAMAVLGGYPQSGENRWCAIALLMDKAADTGTAEPVQTQTAPAVVNDVPKRPTSTEGWSEAKRKMVQSSGIIRNEAAFQDYIRTGWPGIWNHTRHSDKSASERAAYFIHTVCEVESCRDLDPTGSTGQAFRDLVVRYKQTQSGQTLSAQETHLRSGPS